MGIKRVFFFGNGKVEADGEFLTRELLGEKGIGLSEMTSIGLPVPAGFTIATQTCEEYYTDGRKLPKGLEREVEESIAKLERATGKKFGDANDPLVVSVRSGAARSMPGLLETILNLGLNDQTAEGLASKSGNPRFAYDSYRRFIQMYSTTVMSLANEPMDDLIDQAKREAGVKSESKIPVEKLKDLCGQLKAFYKQNKGEDFPQNPMAQLWGAITAVFDSWEVERTVAYRRVEKIIDLKGAAVNVMEMVFGNKGDSSGTGVCFTRNPTNGENTMYGDYLINGQGEDVVAGIRAPLKLATLREHIPEAWKQLVRVKAVLEKHYREVRDIAFTIDEGRLFVLKARSFGGRVSPLAAIRIAVEMVHERLIDERTAVAQVSHERIEKFLRPVFDPQVPRTCLCRGLPVVSGIAVGRIVLDAIEAERRVGIGEKVILVVREIRWADEAGALAAEGVLTSTGGLTSQAAIVCRGVGKPAVTGADSLDIRPKEGIIREGHRTLSINDWISLDGSTGEIFDGAIPLVDPCPDEPLRTFLKWEAHYRPQIELRS